MRIPGIHWLALILLALATSGAGLWLAPASRPVSSAPWGRDYFPNTALIDQDGNHLRFFDDLIEGKVVAINFIFTSCGDTCPLETARLRQVQKLLGESVGRDIHFYSISIDPLHDTPEVLKAYARKFQVAPGWQFLTGDYDDITQLREKLGLLVPGDDPGNLKQHNLSLVVGNQATGEWMKVSPFENPYILADKLGNGLQNWRRSNAGSQSYAEAPVIRPPSNGEQLFRTRCSACHTLGPQDGELGALRSVGPDLLGVTHQRDRAWLIRWLKEPDRMLAENDPLASELFRQFNQVAMPNLQLGEMDIQALLQYLDDETRRQAQR
ncbi:SCO family protein [Metapseudomonas resinovorans]|uniref:Cytochrome c family protein n=1 Tax=Metapseudomonas resinovorans NBRC 106553 TaxID=1245471 RepID=S6BDK4_METRE|nr:SCO family protein [Pseudomonas resinovorans]BAN47134.1 cytochrome c family protein [Pseudomonas resinovorans NBRC 106553]